MGILIDDLIKQHRESNTHIRIGFDLYQAKPYDLQICSIPTFFEVTKQRIKDAFKVLTGKSRAYHYFEDEH